MPPARLPHPAMLRAFPFNLALRLFIRSDIRATQEQLDTFRNFATVGDPLADALAAEMRALPNGRGRFEQALEHGLRSVDDPPPALRAFFEAIETTPIWLDHDKLDVGARTTARTGLLGIYGPLPDVALIGGYLASKPDKVLVRSGDLERKAPRRLAETAQWWIDVTSPGGLDRFGEGFKSIVRVRLTHAHIRAAMKARDDWDFEAWDDPVNQIHMAGTLMLFSTIFTIGLQALGFRFSRKEREAVFHLWRYVGHLIGVDPNLLPTQEADSWRLLWLETATEFEADDDSRRLAQAMVAGTGPMHGINGDGRAARLAVWMLVGLHTSLSRLALGSANADKLGLPNRLPFQAAIAAFAAANFVVETVRSVVPGATSLSVHVGERSRRAALRSITRSTGADLSYTREPVLQDRAAA